MSQHIKTQSKEENYGRLEKMIDSMGELTVHFNGISMYPMLRQMKDLVVIKKVTEPLRINDVPVYRMPSGKVIMHRIIDIKDGKYIIRGDNLFNKELDVTDDLIFGVLKGFYRGKKYVDCNKSAGYKFYVFVWTNIYPLRFLWRKTGYHVYRLVRKILGKIKRAFFK